MNTSIEKINQLNELIEKHEEYRGRLCLNLRADENQSYARVKEVLSSDLGNRNTSPDYRFKYRGTDYMVEIGQLTESLGKELFEAEYINIMCPTGHTANILIYMAFCKPGDKVMSLGPDDGGYNGMIEGKLPTKMGLEVISFVFDRDNMNIDVDKTIELILKEKPKLVIFGATYFLFPHPIQKIAEIVHSYGGIVGYDGAHVLGLIAGKQFQDPLREGADFMFGSTMKSFGGPAGGVIVTNSLQYAEKIEEACSFNAVTAVQWNRIAALGLTFGHLVNEGQEYAKNIVQNSQTLASELNKLNIPMMGKDKNFTMSHCAILDLGDFNKNILGGASKFAEKLEACNIIIDDRGRLGLSELTRIGMGKTEMKIIAKLISRAIHDEDPEKIKQEVQDLRAKFL